MATPNYRHLKKQREQAKRIRNEEKRERRRVKGDDGVPTEDAAPASTASSDELANATDVKPNNSAAIVRG